MTKWIAMSAAFFTAPLGCAAHITTTAQPPQPKQKTHFINTLSKQYHLSQKKVSNILNHAKYLPSVISKITTPYESKPYDIYLRHFLTTQRVNQGAQFWHEHRVTLRKAQEKYGVDPSVIIAILGIETLYGKRKGSYPVLDALYTLSFFYPPRADFFAHELAEYLVMCQNQHISPYSVTGSYAGAFGMPQFMPSSYRAYGVDYSGNHHIDLMHNTDDVIMSVANYLASAGWQANKPVASQLRHINNKHLKQFMSDNALPTTTIADLEKHGIVPTTKTTKQQLASVITLKNKTSAEYWVAFPNLHSIMKYNPSINYAMAVYQLSEAIRKEHGKHTS